MATTQYPILVAWHFFDAADFLFIDVRAGVGWFVFFLSAKCDNREPTAVYIRTLFTTMGYGKLLFGWAGYWLNDRFYLVAIGCAT